MASQEELGRQNQINDALEKRLSLEQELNDALAKRIGIDGEIVFNQRDIGNILTDQLKNLKGHNQEKRSIRNITNQINDLSSKAYSLGEQILGNEKERNKIIKQISETESNIRILNLQKEEFAKKALNSTEEERRLYEAIVSSIGEQVDESIDLNTQLKETVALSEEVSKNFGVKTFGALSDITKKIPGLSRFSEPFQQAMESSSDIAIRMQRINTERTKMGKSPMFTSSKMNLASIQAGIKSLGPALTKALGPAALIVELIQGIMQADKETNELQKSMALTKNEAAGFRLNLGMAASTSGDINITTSKLLETFSSLNKQFGFITNFASQTLVTMTKLTKVVGIGSESAGNLAAASELSGRSFEENYQDVLATSYELQRQSGVQMDLRDILEQTGKVTGTVRANLGANPAQIAKAVTQAKLFGATLQDVANASKALLDFESSITAELEAELLIGKDLNLERARAAALAGDQVTLAQELQKQAGDFEQFSKMNVIQQEAIAKAMGMSSDQLADILFQQEIQGKTAKELRDLGKEELANRLEAQTLADKFNATVDKLKGIFADVGTAFMPVLQLFGAALSLVGALVGLFGDLINLFKGDFDFSGFTNGLQGAAGALGISTADDAIVPAGYGNTIIKKGKDTIALNNNDTVVAGTNLGQGNSEQKRTNQLLERLLNQPAVFKIGTDEFYTATSKYSYQIQ